MNYWTDTTLRVVILCMMAFMLPVSISANAASKKKPTRSDKENSTIILGAPPAETKVTLKKNHVYRLDLPANSILYMIGDEYFSLNTDPSFVWNSRNNALSFPSDKNQFTEVLVPFARPHWAKAPFKDAHVSFLILPFIRPANIVNAQGIRPHQTDPESVWGFYNFETLEKLKYRNIAPYVDARVSFSSSEWTFVSLPEEGYETRFHMETSVPVELRFLDKTVRYDPRNPIDLATKNWRTFLVKGIDHDGSLWLTVTDNNAYSYESMGDWFDAYDGTRIILLDRVKLPKTINITTFADRDTRVILPSTTSTVTIDCSQPVLVKLVDDRSLTCTPSDRITISTDDTVGVYYLRLRGSSGNGTAVFEAR